MPFDLDNIASVEFGVSRGGELFQVPVGNEAKELLKGMLRRTVDVMGGLDAQLPRYDPSEKTAAIEQLSLPLDDPLAGKLKNIFDAVNVPLSAEAVKDPEEIAFYFCAFRDAAGERVMGVRRSAQFKGLLKSRLIVLIDDSLQVLSQNVFRLDPDFDLLVGAGQVLIQKPTAFEIIADLEDKIRESAIQAAVELQEQLPFVDLKYLAERVESRKRIQRLAAAVRGRTDLDQITIESLKQACERHEINGEPGTERFTPTEESLYDFLLLLDRRIYLDPLMDVEPSAYQALSRQKKKAKQQADN